MNQNNIHAAQQNANQFKRQLLFWNIGIVIFNLILLFFVIVVIVFIPSLLCRCSKWKLSSAVKRRQHFMQKHNLIVKPSTIAVDGDIQLSPLNASHVVLALFVSFFLFMTCICFISWKDLIFSLLFLIFVFRWFLDYTQ